MVIHNDCKMTAMIRITEMLVVVSGDNEDYHNAIKPPADIMLTTFFRHVLIGH